MSENENESENLQCYNFTVWPGVFKSFVYKNMEQRKAVNPQSGGAETGQHLMFLFEKWLIELSE